MQRFIVTNGKMKSSTMYVILIYTPYYSLWTNFYMIIIFLYNITKNVKHIFLTKPITYQNTNIEIQHTSKYEYPQNFPTNLAISNTFQRTQPIRYMDLLLFLVSYSTSDLQRAKRFRSSRRRSSEWSEFGIGGIHGKNATWPFDKTHPYIFDNMYNIDGFETWKKRRQPDRFNEYRS